MSASLKLDDFDKVCRLCLSSHDLRSILEEKYLILITSLTNIIIQEGDSFPHNACRNCVKQLDNILYFAEICKSSNVTLNTIITQTKCQVPDAKICIDELSYVEDDTNSCSSKRSPSPLFKEENDTDIIDNHLCCHNCGTNFSSSKSLYKHFKEIKDCRPKDDKSDFELPEKNFEKLTEISDEEKVKAEIFNNDQEFIRGKLIKGKRKFLCNYCGKNYTRKNGLDRHIMSHTGMKPFECKECGKRYITKDTLKTHILIHTGIKPYKCQLCQKSFIQSSHLNYHMRRHAGEKPHTCSFCGKGFLSTYHLERHKLMHTGVKPFKCDLCDKQFVRSTTLRDHLLLHTGERPFQCQHCGKQFNRKQTLTNHVNLVHMEEGANVNNNFSDNFFIEENMPKMECT